MFKKATKWDKPFSEKVAKRVAKIPTADLDTWAVQALNEIGRCLSTYDKDRNKNYLDEALLGAEALHAVIDELVNRTSVR